MRILAIGWVLWACPVAPAMAHGIGYAMLEADGAVAVRIAFSSGEPAAYAQYLVFGPDDEIEFANGRTDAQGRLLFLPDRPGTWRVTVDAGMGHQVRFEVQAGETTAAAPDPPKAAPTWLGITAGLSLIANLALLAALRRRT